MSAGRRFRPTDILLAPYSVFVWLGVIAWMIFLVLTALPLTLLIPFERFQNIWPHPQVGWALYFTLSRVRIVYDPRYRKRRGVMFVQNHVSVLDAHAACAAIPVPLSGLENAAHLKIPGYGWMMRLANAVALGKGEARFAAVAEQIRERVSRGISVLVFPEAHRTVDGRLRPFKRGVFQIARDAGIPVVPLAVRGMYSVLPKGAFIVRPSTLEIYVGPPIDTAGLDDEDVQALSDRVHEIIEGWIEHGRMAPDVPFAPRQSRAS